MNKPSKKRGLSIEEKVVRIEEWFVAHPYPYTMKDLCLILPKATGVISQSVEECMDILVSENRVQQKKVGIHVLFWRFPRTPTQQLATTIGRGASVAEVAKLLGMTQSQLSAEIAELKKKEKDTQRRIKEVRLSIGDDASMKKDTEEIKRLEGEVRSLEKQLSQLALLDPETVEKIKAATNIAWESANRWTDNMYLLEHHISQKMGLSARDLRRQLQIPLEVDFVEYEDLVRPCGGVHNNVNDGRSVFPCNSLALLSKTTDMGDGNSTNDKPAAHHVEEGFTGDANRMGESGGAATVVCVGNVPCGKVTDKGDPFAKKLDKTKPITESDLENKVIEESGNAGRDCGKRVKKGRAKALKGDEAGAAVISSRPRVRR
ncbi:unnamed protein product [Trypanosoma congolense IL3000]|uniref:WGS project CAEQ00000000 data, annotated contig 972 n=1 Tax=Trypanosoma congolense (strain IL3000) TaxID=1068625 RepID=F9WJZ6_TRYCI|nr:unnamed protein product [Trypanosoma congolense IL3000]